MNPQITAPPPAPPLEPTLTAFGRYAILVVAFLGWFGAGVHMSITQLTGRSAATDLLQQTGQLEPARLEALRETRESLQMRWFAWYQCAFLFGAATGGLVFGWVGDRFGRAVGMSASILTYSAMAAVTTLAASPEQWVALWYVTCLGVGGMWPNGVALVSEAWSGLSRPLVAGVIGTSANIGIFCMSTLATQVHITPEAWRWALLVGAAPLALGLFSLALVPESPRWLAAQGSRRSAESLAAPQASLGTVFRRPLLGTTLLGIALATIPVMGGWGTANWMVPWSEKVVGAGAPALKAQVNQARAVTGVVGSLLGGWIAAAVGRRRCYFLVSLACLGIAQYTFNYVLPTDASFLLWVAALGFFSGIYFGWLPLFLPELFPTRARSAGAGVSFNFGRILTAVTVFTAGALSTVFEEDYTRIGRITSLIFLLGLVAICFAPDTGKKQLAD